MEGADISRYSKVEYSTKNTYQLWVHCHPQAPPNITDGSGVYDTVSRNLALSTSWMAMNPVALLFGWTYSWSEYCGNIWEADKLWSKIPFVVGHWWGMVCGIYLFSLLEQQKLWNQHNEHSQNDGTRDHSFLISFYVSKLIKVGGSNYDMIGTSI